MAPARRSARNIGISTPSSVTTKASLSVFSGSNSQQSSPPTSDPEDQGQSKSFATTQSRSVIRPSNVVSSPLKRTRKADSENPDASDKEHRKPKRRSLARMAFVEIPKRKTSLNEINKSVFKIPQINSSPSSDIEELLSADELEYRGESSEDDGDSEFQLSEDEEEAYDGSDNEELKLAKVLNGLDDDEAESLMLSTAIELSKSSMDNMQSSASSSRNTKTRSTASALRAAAAERRLAAEGMLHSDTEVIGISTSEESEPLAKSKGKASATKKTVTRTQSRITSLAQRRAERRAAKQETRLAKNETKRDEMELKKKLGRKLTHAEKTTIALYVQHPELRTVWGDVEESIPITIPERHPQPPGLKLTLLPFQQESLHWMKKQEKGVWAGGMLADEMGMGKTIQTIALFVLDRQQPNLIVAPTVAVMQWKNELETHTEGFKVLVWHGASRERNFKELIKYDVVLTTYAVLESCFRKQQSGFKRKGKIIKEQSPLHTIEWKRIILDEAHNIKERSTNTAKAAFELKSKYKWCLSGTPLQNRVGELYSLIRFLGGDPFSYYFCKRCDCKSLHWSFSDKRSCDGCGHSPMQHTCFWNNEILTPIQKHGMIGPGKIAFKKLKILLDRMMLRRTKIERADDLGLPPRTVIVRRDYFSDEEKELYLSLFSDAKRQFSTYVDSGTLLNNYSNIFSLITRMRQMACHPDLVLKSKRNVGTLTVDSGEAAVCRLCHDTAEDAIQSRCRHIFDRECIKQYITTAVEDTPACPVCHLPLSIDLEAPALEFDGESKLAANKQGILGRLDLETWRSSSKIEVLVEELTNLRRQDATTKSIVFSQFVSFLDLIAFRLQRAGFTICRLEGTMSPQARDATIKYFMNNVNVTIFLVSLKAGGVALNLTEASRVYLMDSWWNPAVEYQAMDRIHRLGQHRPVKAIKLVIEDSIESRIIQLQEKKSAMVDATLSPDDSAMGRLTPEDLSFLFRL